MKINFIVIGKSNSYIKKGVEEYQKRMRKYINFEITEIAIPKKLSKLSKKEQKKEEQKLLAPYFSSCNKNYLLDENGKQFTSVEFSELIQKDMIAGQKCVNFVVGGAYGFSDEILSGKFQKISLSKMTFSHQMVRLFFVEQIYRAMTILKSEPYHH